MIFDNDRQEDEKTKDWIKYADKLYFLGLNLEMKENLKILRIIETQCKNIKSTMRYNIIEGYEDVLSEDCFDEKKLYCYDFVNKHVNFE